MTTHDLHEVNPFYQHAVAEHRDLHQAFENVRIQLGSSEQTEARFADIVGLLRQLRDRLAQHFAQEENGGYLEEAITRLPRIESQAAILQRQHGEFLNSTNQLLHAAGSTVTLVERWTALREGYARLMKRLEAHESAENKLLQAAFNEDADT